jgi:hypothetical protein
MVLVARPDKGQLEIPGAFAASGFPLLEFDRKPIDPDALIGFALEWNPDLTLVQIIENQSFRLNGYAIFRNSDVRRWRPIPEDDFTARAAILNKLRPSKPDAVTVGSMREAISSAGATFPLITIHRERIKRGVCFVGRMLRTSQRATTIMSISPDAEWEGEECYSLRDITLLEFGGAYEKLLLQMAKKRVPGLSDQGRNKSTSDSSARMSDGNT